MPNRIIKESICTSDSLDELSWFEEVLFYRLIVNCDDYGCFDGRIPIIKNKLFPLKDELAQKTVSDGLNGLVKAGLVHLYESEGKPYLYLTTWNRHQTVRAKRRKYPDPEETCKQMQADDFKRNQPQANVPVIQSNPIQSVSISERESNGRKTPSLEEIEAFAKERNSPVDPKRFFAYYNFSGWKDGHGNPITNWKQKLIAWEGTERNSRPADQKPKNIPEWDDEKAIRQLERLRRKMEGENVEDL